MIYIWYSVNCEKKHDICNISNISGLQEEGTQRNPGKNTQTSHNQSRGRIQTLKPGGARTMLAIFYMTVNIFDLCEYKLINHWLSARKDAVQQLDISIQDLQHKTFHWFLDIGKGSMVDQHPALWPWCVAVVIMSRIGISKTKRSY